MNENTEILNNGLKISIDWVSFTITAPMSVNDVIEFMGFKTDTFVDMPRGAQGYRCMKKCAHADISVLFDGSDDMGIHINVTGSGVSTLLDTYKEKYAVNTPFGKGYDLEFEKLLGVFCKEVCNVGHFTRLDVAIDDIGGKYYSPNDLYERHEKGCIVSKFRKCTRNDSYNSKHICDGYTIYFGSRQSEIMLRCYDKKLEQNQGNKNDTEITQEWYRWELELKDKRAMQLAELLIDSVSLGQIVIGVLSHYFRIIVKDDCNKSRCSNEKKWDEFIGNISKLRLSCSAKKKTLYDKEVWIENQIAPSLCTLLIAYGGDYQVIMNMIIQNRHRIGKADKELLREKCPGIYEQFLTDYETNDY